MVAGGLVSGITMVIDAAAVRSGSAQCSDGFVVTCPLLPSHTRGSWCLLAADPALLCHGMVCMYVYISPQDALASPVAAGTFTCQQSSYTLLVLLDAVLIVLEVSSQVLLLGPPPHSLTLPPCSLACHCTDHCLCHALLLPQGLYAASSWPVVVRQHVWVPVTT